MVAHLSTHQAVDIQIGRSLVVRLGNDEVRFRGLGPACEFGASLLAMVADKRSAFRDERLKVGHFLRSVRSQVDHGEWLTFLEDLAEKSGISARCLRRSEGLARRVCDHTGAASAKKVRKSLASKGPNWPHCGQFEAKCGAFMKGGKMPELSYRELELIAGSREKSSGEDAADEPENDTSPLAGGAGRETGDVSAETGVAGLRPPPADRLGEVTEGRSDGVTEQEKTARARKPDVVGQIGMGSLYERAMKGVGVAARMVDDLGVRVEVRERARRLLEELAELVAA